MTFGSWPENQIELLEPARSKFLYLLETDFSKTVLVSGALKAKSSFALYSKRNI